MARFAASAPDLRAQADLSLQQSGAYLSWSAPAAPGQLPLTLWLDLFEIHGALSLNDLLMERYVLPLVFVADTSWALGRLEPDATLRGAYEAALAACRTPPTGFTREEQEKARVKAERYSDRPWLFMRYEMKNGERRLAVNWAPVRHMSPGLVFAWDVD